MENLLKTILILFTRHSRATGGGTDYNTILSFDEKHIFNFQENNNANGIVQNQQVTDKGAWQQLVDYLKEENSVLKNKLEKFSK